MKRSHANLVRYPKPILSPSHHGGPCYGVSGAAGGPPPWRCTRWL